jgi:PAS domain S-box-containing protein
MKEVGMKSTLENTMATFRNLLANCKAEKSPHKQAQIFEQLYTMINSFEVIAQVKLLENETALAKSEAAFRMLFEFSPLPYLFFDHAGIIDCNRAAVRMLQGQDKKEILVKHPAMFSPEYQPDGQLSRVKAMEMDRIAHEKGINQFEWTLRTLTGKCFQAEITVAPVTFNDKTLVLSLWRDLSEKKQIEEALATNEKLLTTVLETLPIAVFAKDIKKGFKWNLWNKHAEILFGINAEACLGKTDSDMFPLEQAELFKRKDLEAIKTLGVVVINEELADTAHGQVLLNTRKIVIGDANNEPSILLGVTEDITERRKLEKKARDRELELKQALERARTSEESVREIFENSPIGMIRVDTELNILMVSPAFAKFVGYEIAELLKMKSLDFTHPDDRASTLAWVDQITDKMPVTHIEKRYIHKAGHTVWGRATAQMGRSPQTGNPILVAAIEDITERRVLQNWNKTVLNSSVFPIIATTLDGTVSTFNKAAEKQLGYAASEIVGKMSAKIFYDRIELVGRSKILAAELGLDVKPDLEAVVIKARRLGQDIQEWTYVRKNGSQFPVRLSVSPIYDQEEQCIGYLSIAEDLTEFKKLEEAIQTEKAQAVHTAKLASLGEMSAGIAHEINNPLSIIIASLPLLTACKDDQTKLDLKLAIIAKASHRIEKIVNGLRKFSRCSTGVVHKNESLNDLIKDTLVMTETKAKRHSTKISIGSEIEASIVCDGVEIEQVLINLINNGIDAAKGGDERWLKINVIVEKEHIVIQVINSGPMISPEIEQRLFEPFFTTKAVGKGTGLGLSISKRILDSHNATLRLNRSFANTCFEICFPAPSTKLALKSAS